jgi:hypothetical protein
VERFARIYLTTTVAVMYWWMLQRYLNVPAVPKVWLKP